MKRLLLAAVCSVLMTASAWAGQCPADMGKIDAALANNPDLSADQLAEVNALRAEGEALHEAGDHAQSVKVLGDAKAILGIE